MHVNISTKHTNIQVKEIGYFYKLNTKCIFIILEIYMLL